MTTAARKRVLLVDDEPNVLSAIQRHIRGRLDVETANSAAEALEKLTKFGPFAVVVSDMQMPGKSGAELLAEVRTLAPQTTRVMLTGNSDQGTAIRAVNEGAIFRFLNKPCPPDVLERTIREGIEQYELLQVERELLEQTLMGAVRAMSEIIATLSPELGGLATSASQAAGAIARGLGHERAWQVEVAALLLHAGVVTFPQEMIQAVAAKPSDKPDPSEVLGRVTAVSARLIENIPRLEPVGRIVRAAGGATPAGLTPGEANDATIVRAAYFVVQSELHGVERGEALRRVARSLPSADTTLAAAFIAAFPMLEQRYEERAFKLKEIRLGMKLARSVETAAGGLLLREGHEFTAAILERVRNFAEVNGIKEPIWVLVPVS